MDNFAAIMQQNALVVKKYIQNKNSEGEKVEKLQPQATGVHICHHVLSYPVCFTLVPLNLGEGVQNANKGKAFSLSRGEIPCIL